MAEEKKLFKVTIDNIALEVEPGTTILMAARKIGGDVVPPAITANWRRPAVIALPSW